MNTLNNTQKIYLFFRSIVERVLAFFLLILLSPVFLLVSLIILVTMGRPIFFIQSRMGRNNQPFKMYKFRSMRNDNQVMAYATTNDPRTTAFGKMIRKRRIDELPQFLNIIKGDMSLIGPRPEPMPFAEKYLQSIENYGTRHQVKPGITGFAQVKTGYADSEDSTRIKVAHDLEYVKNLSPFLDFTIVLQTIKIMLTGFGAR